jgi:hypothetical protein
MRDFQDLEVWQAAYEMALAIYELTDLFSTQRTVRPDSPASKVRSLLPIQHR